MGGMTVVSRDCLGALQKPQWSPPVMGGMTRPPSRPPPPRKCRNGARP